jgi:hypothetical protein
MKLSEIKSQRCDLAIDVMGGVLNVTYDPTYITPEVEDAIADATDSEQMIDLVVGMVKEWDLIGDDDKPVPLEADSLKTLPTIILGHVLSKVAEDAPNVVRAEGKRSPATSRRKA